MAQNQDKFPPGVMLYSGFYEALKALPLDMVGTLTIALMEYNMFGTVPAFEGIAAFAWAFIKDYADHDQQRYQQQVERRRAAAEKRWNSEREKSKTPSPRREPPKSTPYGIKGMTCNQTPEGANWMKKYMDAAKTAESQPDS